MTNDGESETDFNTAQNSVKKINISQEKKFFTENTQLLSDEKTTEFFCIELNRLWWINPDNIRSGFGGKLKYFKARKKILKVPQGWIK